MLKYKSAFAIFLVLTLAVMAGIGFWMHIQAFKGGMVSGILTGRPCAPPCWHGITPGMSIDRSVVIRSLRRMPAVETVREEVVQDGYCIKWFWRKSPGANFICTDWKGSVASISLNVDFDLIVADIVGKYGLPVATNAAPFIYAEEIVNNKVHVTDKGYIMMNLFYPQYGFNCRAKVMPFDRPVLEPQTKVYEVVYYIPADSLESWLSERAEPMRLQPWPGYGELNKEAYGLP